MSAPLSPPLKSQAQVREYLGQMGYKAPGRSAMSNHAKAGKLRTSASGEHAGLYTEAEIQAYIKLAGLKRLDGSVDSELRAAVRQRQQAETRKIIAQAELAEIRAAESQGRLIPRAQYEADLAARARALKASITAFFRLSIDELVDLVEGDPLKAPEALDFCLDRAAAWFDSYAEAGELSPEPPK